MSCSKEDNLNSRYNFALDLISMCESGNCPDEVYCSTSNGDYNYVIYKWGEFYYEVAWLSSTNEVIHNDNKINQSDLGNYCN